MKKKIFGFPVNVGFLHTMSMILSTEKSGTLQGKLVEYQFVHISSTGWTRLIRTRLIQTFTKITASFLSFEN